MKLCKDCKHFRTKRIMFLRLDEYGICHAKGSAEPDLITGSTNYRHCQTMRTDYTYVETCGREGRWFEPKEKA